MPRDKMRSRDMLIQKNCEVDLYSSFVFIVVFEWSVQKQSNSINHEIYEISLKISFLDTMFQDFMIFVCSVENRKGAKYSIIYV